MSERSRSQVTITLGRSGQVVKRAGSPLDSYFIDSALAAGSKRSVRDRLGSNLDSSGQFSHKRQRRDGNTANAIDDIHLSKGDLRFKILQKSRLKHGQNDQQNSMDLRNILSRPAQSSTNSPYTGAWMPEPKESRLHHTDPKDGKQHFPEKRGGRKLMTMFRDSRQSSPVDREQYIREPREQHVPNPREKRVPEAREGRQSIPELKDFRSRMPEPSRSSMMRNIPGPRTANAVIKVDSVINSYSPWTLDRIKQRSPDEVLAPSRRQSPPNRDLGLQRRLPVRAHDDAGTSTYISKDAFEFSRPTSSNSYLMKTVPPVAQVKTVSPVVPRLLPGSLAQKSPYVVDVQTTVDSFFRSLGLEEKYAILCKAEEVDMYSLRQMDDNDLKSLQIPMGPRKKILNALLPPSKRHTS